jgi:nucleotide-binding universal stress UspA family protein
VAADQMVSRRPFPRILTGTDGSERGTEAARQAARLAAAFGAQLTLAYVIERKPHEEGEADRALEGAIAAVRSVSVEAAETEILTGDPAEALIQRADQDEIDLVCVGPDSGPLGGAIRFGRVAARILREARCSVLVARRAGAEFPERIACAIDGSESSVHTAITAATVAQATGAELRLVHVVPVFRGHITEWTLGPEEESPAELEPSVSAVSSLGVMPIREMAMGRPERALVSVAERDQIDLMVVGHRGISGVQRVLLGSVNEHVAHHAPCSVLVVRST